MGDGRQMVPRKERLENIKDPEGVIALAAADARRRDHCQCLISPNLWVVYIRTHFIAPSNPGPEERMANYARGRSKGWSIRPY